MGLERERHYENATRIFTTLIHKHIPIIPVLSIVRIPMGNMKTR